MVGVKTVILLILLYCGRVVALGPDEILAVANGDIAESVQIAQYYCEQRGVPDMNILALPLSANLKNSISREDCEE